MLFDMVAISQILLLSIWNVTSPIEMCHNCNIPVVEDLVWKKVKCLTNNV